MKGETVAKLKVAINGFGRIGRNFLRCWHGREDSPLDVIAVNDSGGVKNVMAIMIYSSSSLIFEYTSVMSTTLTFRDTLERLMMSRILSTFPNDMCLNSANAFNGV